jgi:signal transduction histidine kinase
VVPNLKQVVILGDDFGSQAAAPFRQFDSEIPAVVAENLEVVNLTGVPLAELRKRVSTLPDRSAILYTPIYSDGAGTILLPSNVVAMLAAVANRPIIAPVENYLNHGAIGGFVVVPSVLGEETAEQVLEIIDGRDPASMQITSGNSIRPIFDWKELRRWGADIGHLPEGSEIRNRPLPIWKEYPLQTAIGVIVVLLQSGFIVALLYEHRRRRRAEVDASARLNELAHVNRRATAGELSASIAHELNQPLGAALAHTEACELIVSRPSPDVELIKEILADIRHENQRAGEVIARLQRLLRKAQVQMDEFDLNAAVQDVLKFVAGQMRASEIGLTDLLAPEPLRIRGDWIQIQQVVLNLIVNSVDAIRDSGAGIRRITVRTRRTADGHAEIIISDTGSGIAPDKLKEIFEPFFTTKAQGMGMGLSIARTIVTAHGGSIVAQNQPDGGAEFRVLLLLAGIEQA